MHRYVCMYTYKILLLITILLITVRPLTSASNWQKYLTIENHLHRTVKIGKVINYCTLGSVFIGGKRAKLG